MTLAKAIPPLLFFALLLLAWEVAVALFRVPPYLLPAPTAIGAALVSGAPLLLASAATTLRITLGAFAIAFSAGLLLALAFSASRFLTRAALPFVIALQVTPVIAIAPLIIVWVGIDRPELAMLILAAIVGFFPVLANAMIGLASTDPGHRQLFKLYGASRAETFLRLELMSALPYLLSGAKVSAGLSLVGAVVAEFVAGSGASQGLAWRIIEAGNRLQIPSLFAALALLTLIGLFIFAVLSAVENVVLGAWHESRIG